MAYTEKALHLLKERGYRLTEPRRRVLALLEAQEQPLSPYEIRDLLLKQGEKIDAVSVYRILDCLEENHLVHRLMSHQGKVLKCHLEDEHDCQLPQTDHCHHFLICRHCHTIEEIHCVGLQPVVDGLAAQTGFQVERHHLEFVGLCQQCCQLSSADNKK